MTKRKKPQPQSSANSLQNAVPLMDERAALHREKKALEDRIKMLDEQLRPLLMDRGAVFHNGFQHEVASVPGRKTVDYKAMAEDFNIDMEPYTKVGAPSTRYTIKEVQQL